MQIIGRIADENPKNIDKPRLSERHRKIRRVWIVVADGGVAKIFKKNGKHFECLGLATPSETSALLTNKSVGRVISASTSNVHHKYEPHVTERYQKNISFARELAQWLEKTFDENAFDELIIAAAPRMLGYLRKESSKKLQTAIASEISKDLTGHSENALRKELSRTIQPSLMPSIPHVR